MKIKHSRTENFDAVTGLNEYVKRADVVRLVQELKEEWWRPHDEITRTQYHETLSEMLRRLRDL